MRRSGRVITAYRALVSNIASRLNSSLLKGVKSFTLLRENRETDLQKPIISMNSWQLSF